MIAPGPEPSRLVRRARRLAEAGTFLATVPPFVGLEADVLQWLARHAVRAPFRTGAMLSTTDRAGAGLSILHTGAAKVCTAARAGRVAVLALLGPRDHFGELCLLAGAAGEARVQAMRAGDLLHIPVAILRQLIEERPAVLAALLRETAARVRGAEEAVRRLALEDVHGRVADVLRQLADECGEPCDDGVWIERRPSQQVLAGMAGSTRETVSRVLKELEARAWIACEGRRILLRTRTRN